MRTELLTLTFLFSGPAIAQETPGSSGSAGSSSNPEPIPFVLGINQAYTRESNLFRAPDGGTVVSDSISSTGVRLGIDKPLGRQRISADLRANANRYRSNKQLDNTDYRIGARLDWATVERISGELSAEQAQSLYNDTLNGVLPTERNQVRSSSAAFQARVGLITRWSFEAGAAASENDYRGASVDNRDLRQQSVNAGLRWRPSDLLSTRLGLRHGQGSYPRFGTEPDNFKRDDLDLSTTVDASGASRLEARLSATRERHTLQSQRDNKGWTGALGWHWRPTGKLSSQLDLSRDSSVGRTSFGSSLISAEASDARLSEAASLSIAWEATAKIQVVPHASYQWRKLDNAFSATGASAQLATDRTSSVGIGLHYQPIPALELGCELAREQRKVDGSAALSAPYSADTARCSLQFSLR